MAFNLSAAIGGAAKRGSEILEEERRAARETANDAFKVLIETGLPEFKKRKQLRMNKEKIYDTLRNDHKFSPSQINVIMRQDRGQAVIDHITSMQDTYRDYKVNPADIVSITQDYEGDLTKDMILSNVMGKVQGGMNLSDAVYDVTGTRPSTGLTGLLGGDAMAGPLARIDALSAAAGVSSSDLASYASGEVSYDPAYVQGSVSLYDSRKRQPGQITETNAMTRLESEAIRRFGGTLKVVDDEVRYEDVMLADQIKARQYANEALIVFSEALRDGKTGPEALMLANEALANKNYQRTKEAETDGDTIYDGMTVSSIVAELTKKLEGTVGLVAINRNIALAEKALIEALKKDMGEEEAKTEAKRIIEEIKNNLN